jgi:hypothetical protein
VYAWDPHRKKIPVEGEVIPLIRKRGGVLAGPYFVFFCISERRYRERRRSTSGCEGLHDKLVSW